MKDNDVMSEKAAKLVNIDDWKLREGHLKGMLQYDFPFIIGLDAAGKIKEVGKNVTKFRIGDNVFTRPDITRNGTYAEYVAVDETLVAKNRKICLLKKRHQFRSLD